MNNVNFTNAPKQLSDYLCWFDYLLLKPAEPRVWLHFDCCIHYTNCFMMIVYVHNRTHAHQIKGLLTVFSLLAVELIYTYNSWYKEIQQGVL